MECNEQIIDKLSKIELFSDFSEKNSKNMNLLAKVCNLLEPENFSKGDVIIKEGEIGDSLFILYEGTVEVRRNTAGNEQFAVVNLNASQNVFFGEVALIDRDSRSASVVALENCRTLCLDGNKFQLLCSEEVELGYKVMYKIARRIAASLRRSNKDLRTLYEALLDEVHGE